MAAEPDTNQTNVMAERGDAEGGMMLYTVADGERGWGLGVEYSDVFTVDGEGKVVFEVDDGENLGGIVM